MQKVCLNMDLKNTCFLCKKSAPGITEEHVFPQWLQRDYDLREQFILLKNGTKFKYKNLTVPCCQECNSIHLSIIENKVSKAIRENDVKSLLLNPDQTFIWLYKLMYGLHYKELFLKSNIKDPLSEHIVDKNDFFQKHSYNIFPLFARGEVEFNNFSPYSLFVFKLSDSIKGKYYYVDEPNKMYSSIILGNIGIVCSFQCDGYIYSDIQKHMNINNISTLSLPEFGDFSAFVLHLKTRMKMLPNYLCHKENGKFVFKIQKPADKFLYSNFDTNRQFEFTSKMFTPLFEKLIETDSNGERVIKYKSPFIYF